MPSIAFIMSPTLIPALLAGLPSSTLVIVPLTILIELSSLMYKPKCLFPFLLNV